MNQKGQSLHIGINDYDTKSYQVQGWKIGNLNGCINDATSMQLLAAQRGFITQILTDDQATASEVTRLIASSAQSLNPGDFFFVTFSGHGAQIPDVNGDEDDGYDETWALYDRMLIDDELFRLFGQFKNGVRIFMLSDSCHSGTVARMLITSKVAAVFREVSQSNWVSRELGPMLPSLRGVEAINNDRQEMRAIDAMKRVASQTAAFRGIPTVFAKDIYAKNKELYDNLQYLSGRSKDADFGASLILISGCQDNQVSRDGTQHGLFTQTLLDAWKNGAFSGNYHQLHQEILASMPSDQTPNFYTLGDTSEFSAQDVLRITTQTFTPTSSVEPNMTVLGSENLARVDLPPNFQVDTQGAPYFVTEFATDLDLFDYTNHGDERNETNFWASWSDSPVYEYAKSDGFFPMPTSAWNSLKLADTIYYRVGTTTASSGYPNYHVSTADDATEGPHLLIKD